MLLRVIIKNFLSIGEELEFNTFPYEKLGRFSHHIYDAGEEVNLLKASALYGANGSGKSNFTKAVHLLHDIATDQKGGLSIFDSIYFKLSEACKSTPTSIEIEFKNEGIFFAYGVDIIDHKISSEWLYKLFPKEGKQELIFERKYIDIKQVEIEVASAYQAGEKDKLLLELYEEDRDLLPHHKSLISRLKGKEKFKEVNIAFNWFLMKLFVVYPQSKYASLIDKIVMDEMFFSFANSILSRLDTGIEKLEITELSLDEFFGENDEEKKQHVVSELGKGVKRIRLHFQKGIALAVKNDDDNPIVKKLITKHASPSGGVENFDLVEESDGTLRVLDLIPIFEFILQKDFVCFIDEIGRSIHPSLLKELIKYLLAQPTKGQLFFTTHESHLLDLEIFRQDEIWFVEKDQSGNTKMYPLSDFKPRYDLNIRKGYLKGRFGAIPFLSDFSKLIPAHATAK